MHTASPQGCAGKKDSILWCCQLHCLLVQLSCQVLQSRTKLGSRLLGLGVELGLGADYRAMKPCPCFATLLLFLNSLAVVFFFLLGVLQVLWLRRRDYVVKGFDQDTGTLRWNVTVAGVLHPDVAPPRPSGTDVDVDVHVHAAVSPRR
jgi:hypothetical protein